VDRRNAGRGRQTGHECLTTPVEQWGIAAERGMLGRRFSQLCATVHNKLAAGRGNQPRRLSLTRTLRFKAVSIVAPRPVEISLSVKAVLRIEVRAMGSSRDDDGDDRNYREKPDHARAVCRL
jgi:hypothetical protein